MVFLVKIVVGSLFHKVGTVVNFSRFRARITFDLLCGLILNNHGIFML